MRQRRWNFHEALFDEVFLFLVSFIRLSQLRTGRVRCMITANHTKEQLDKAIEIIENVGRKLNII